MVKWGDFNKIWQYVLYWCHIEDTGSTNNYSEWSFMSYHVRDQHRVKNSIYQTETNKNSKEINGCGSNEPMSYVG